MSITKKVGMSGTKVLELARLLGTSEYVNMCFLEQKNYTSYLVILSKRAN